MHTPHLDFNSRIPSLISSHLPIALHLTTHLPHTNLPLPSQYPTPVTTPITTRELGVADWGQREGSSRAPYCGKVQYISPKSPPLPCPQSHTPTPLLPVYSPHLSPPPHKPANQVPSSPTLARLIGKVIRENPAATAPRGRSQDRTCVGEAVASICSVSEMGLLVR